MKKNVAYIRVSTDKQAEFGYGLSDQKYKILQYINLYSEEINEKSIEWYIDDGYSAKSLDRKHMKKLIAEINEDKVERVIIHNLDRLTRSVADLSHMLSLFDQHKVELVSIKEKIETTSALGRFFVFMIVLVAQWERETVSERTIRAIDQAAREGKHIYGSAPFGYERVEGKLKIVEQDAEIVRKIYEYYTVDQFSSAMIAIILNSKPDNETRWKRNRIREILQNPIYIGTYVNKRIEIENHSPAIIDNEMFEITQKQIKNRAYYRTYIYQYQNLCYDNDGETPLGQESAYNRHGTLYLYYSRKKGRIRINEKRIDEQIGRFVDKWVEDNVKTEVKHTIKKMKQEDNLVDLVLKMNKSGLIGDSYTEELLGEINDKVDHYTKIISVLLKRMRTWDIMTKRERRKFVVTNIQKIVINPVQKKVISVEFSEKI